MDFRDIRFATQAARDGIPISANLTQLPTNILETLVPGYSLISRFMLDIFGFDISLFVSVFALGFGFLTACKWGYSQMLSQVDKFFTASVTVDADDDIFDYLLEWISQHKVGKKSRSLKVRSGQETAWDSSDEDVAEDDISAIANAGVLFNFSNWAAKVPPRYEPRDGADWFWHNGHYFRLDRGKDMIFGTGYFGRVFTEDEKLTLTVFGRSTEPIKSLIIEAREQFRAKEQSKTTVRRPAPKEQRQRGRYAWSKVATRPSRPIETVILDNEQKHMLLTDINEFVHPATPRWYSVRGVPYRRGYLFHGPPGTGKTSLSFAIAGVFGLDIYCISLLEPSLTEEDLSLLFNSLPRRCVVLLEDIDSAGLVRNKASDDLEKSENESGGAGDTGANLAKEVAKAFQSVNDRQMRNRGPNGDDKQGISLSGLLNAIDGVASHEGRVLVMTTNHPEKLDEALIRPGRVDMKIGFTLATKDQIEELFVRMYSPGSGRPLNLASTVEEVLSSRHVQTISNEKAALLVSNFNAEAKAHNHFEAGPFQSLYGRSMAGTFTPPETPAVSSRTSLSAADTSPASYKNCQDLGVLASAFSSLLPDSVFSPAEIQGFLLTRKKEPHRALAEVEAWRDEALRAKNTGGPVAAASAKEGEDGA